MIKLSKALKIKNNMVKEIQALNAKIQKHNRVEEGKPAVYNTLELYKELQEKIVTYSVFKAEICKANDGIWSKIFMLAEAKGLLNVLQGMQCEESTDVYCIHGGGNREVNRIPIIDQLKRDKMISDVEKDIVKFQDDIDDYNASHYVHNISEVDGKILIEVDNDSPSKLHSEPPVAF